MNLSTWAGVAVLPDIATYAPVIDRPRLNLVEQDAICIPERPKKQKLPGTALIRTQEEHQKQYRWLPDT